MKTLIVEDDFTSRYILQEMLSPYGEVHIAVNGKEAVKAVEKAYNESDPYDLLALDILMPEMDGQETLKEIRSFEETLDIFPGNGAKILMTTGLDDKDNIFTAFREQCDGYLTKPLSREKLVEYLESFELI